VSPAGTLAKARWDTPGDVTSIAFDAAGRLFIGTEDGFGCLTQGHLKWWSARDGIGGERVNDLATDATTLWVGYGEDGFSAVPLADLR
jgi:ligand-binding sensor domain-containing protein